MKVHFVKRILRSPKWVSCLKLKHYCLLAKHDRRSEQDAKLQIGAAHTDLPGIRSVYSSLSTGSLRQKTIPTVKSRPTKTVRP